MEEEKEKSIYELKIHEKLVLSPYCDVFRVHSGWIYVFYSYTTIHNSNNKDISINNSIFVKDDRSK